MAFIASVLTLGLSTTPPLRPISLNRIQKIRCNKIYCNAELSRADRRASWWSEHQPDEPSIVLQNPQLAVHKGDTSHRRRFLGPHPLVPLLAEAEEDSTLADPEAAARGAAEGDRVWCQVIGESPLGLSVAILPDGASGLVYTDEAGFAPEDGTGVPAALGDVVQGYVQKVRHDLKIDVCWRKPGKLPRLQTASATVLEALLRNDGEALPLGDASPPEAIKLKLGLSKSAFKAARGQLLKAGLLHHPMAAEETKLAEGVTSWPDGWQRPDGVAASAPPSRTSSSPGSQTTLELSKLPPAAAKRVSGACALLRLFATHGEVLSLRGLVADGAPSGRVLAVYSEPSDAVAAHEELAKHEKETSEAGVEGPPPPRARLVDSVEAPPTRRYEPPAAAAAAQQEGAWKNNEEDEGAWDDEYGDEDPHAEWVRGRPPQHRGGRYEPPSASRGRYDARSGGGRYGGDDGAASGRGYAAEDEWQRQQQPPPSGGDAASTPRTRPNSIFVGNLPYDATEDDLWELFLDAGYISKVWLATDKEGQPRGFGRITFADGTAVTAAMRLRGALLRGRRLRIEASLEKPEGSGRDARGGRGGRGGGERDGAPERVSMRGGGGRGGGGSRERPGRGNRWLR